MMEEMGRMVRAVDAGMFVDEKLFEGKQANE